MWRWFRNRGTGNNRPAGSDPPSAGPPPSTAGESGGIVCITRNLADIVNEMKEKGYQGPFAYLCDGIKCILLHGPNVSMNPNCIEANATPFQMRVVDCREFCSDTFMYGIGDDDEATLKRFSISESDTDKLCRSPRDPHVQPCLLGYPLPGGQVRDGLQAVAKSMEDLWHVIFHEGHFYFLRSWSGQPRYRAKARFFENSMFLTEVAADATMREDPFHRDTLSNDPTFGVRQVDFLIKSLLLRLLSPAPLPRNESAEPGAMALSAFGEYGRIGWFASLDDTTEYRICLNGTPGRFAVNPDNPFLVEAISAFNAGSAPNPREHLFEALRHRTLLLEFLVPDKSLHQGRVSKDGPFQIVGSKWDGQPCFFAYTDAAYRILPSHGCIPVKGSDLADIARHHDERAGVVINPGGPATCKLEPSDLRMLESESEQNS